MTRPQAHRRKLKAISRVCAALVGAVVLTGALSLHGQAPASKTRSHVAALASEKLEGRLVGSNGERLASEYLVSQLRRIGAKPLPGASDFLLPFEFTAGTRDGGSTATITDTRSNANRAFNARSDVQALSFSDNGDANGSVVFAGYGIVVPEAQKFGYDSYATLDVNFGGYDPAAWEACP